MDDRRIPRVGPANKSEHSFPTERDAAVPAIDEPVHQLQYNPRAHYEAIRQWVDRTRPRKKSVDESTTLDEVATAAPWRGEGDDDDDDDFVAAGVQLMQDEWQQKQFDRAFASIRRKYEPRFVNEAFENRRLCEKVNRYRKAFLKGFFEARIKRVEANKWLYDQLHVTPESIKEKYRKLMFETSPRRCPREPAQQPFAEEGGGGGRVSPRLPHHHNDDEDDARSDSSVDDDLDTESVFSFVPERDNVLLQDENAPPLVRGFGHHGRMKYDPSVKLLDLDGWLPSDVQHFLDEKHLQELRRQEEMQEEKVVARDEEVKGKGGNNIDWKYEQIPGMQVDLPQWLGPHKLDEQEMAPPMAAAEAADEAQAAGDPPFARGGREEHLRELAAESKHDYKLWYSTHDMFNSTPFMEARLQRLLREVLGKREWKLFRECVRDRPTNAENAEENEDGAR